MSIQQSVGNRGDGPPVIVDIYDNFPRKRFIKRGPSSEKQIHLNILIGVAIFVTGILLYRIYSL